MKTDEHNKLTKSKQKLSQEPLDEFSEASKLQQLNEELKKEKEKAQQYLRLSSIIFLALDKEGNITMINNAGCKMLGYGCRMKNGKCQLHEESFCQMEGRNWFENFIPEDERENVRTVHRNILSGNLYEVEHFENTVLCKDGGKRIIAWHNSLLKDDEGNFTGTISSGIDITERVQAENAMKESEEMFRTLFETASESIIIINAEGEIMTVNHITVEIFGYAKKELYGKSIELLIPQRFKEKHVAGRKKHQENPHSRPMGIGKEFYAQRKDGTEFPVEISLSTIQKGKELLTMALITDITKQKQAKEKLENLNTQLEQKVAERTQTLKESQQLYMAIARNFPNGVINVLDKDFNYVFVDGMEMYKKGIGGDVLVGTNFIKRIDPEIKQGIKKKLISVFEGKNKSFELKTGNKTYMINAVGLKDADNKISQILVVSQNITKLKNAEEDIQRSLEKEKHLNELKSRFVSMASHEFRTPLTSIMNSTSLILRYFDMKNTEEKRRKHIHRIQNSVHYLANILNDFLSLDKLEQGKIEINYSEFNLPKFSQEIIEELDGILKEGQKISYQHQGETNIYFDNQMLKNIFNNLLSNAVKYSPQESIVELETIAEKGYMTAIFRDKGIGIPKNEQKHLFERFFRAKNALNIQGTGLGLNLVKKYIEIVEGEIDFISTPDKGTIFTVRLPIEESN